MKSLDEVNQVLKNYIPKDGLSKKVYTLDRMRKLMITLGNPQEQYQIIHVAGTSGKTSTCYYATALLKAAGLKVGLTISPHINSINERVQINLEPLPEEIFAKKFEVFMDKIRSSKLEPTYFEIMIAFAYWYFAEAKVDCAVIETGMGGLLDGTNVVINPSKICVLSRIGLDHTQILGSTIKEIAHQKAGIIQPGNTVIYIDQASEATNVFRGSAREQSATIHRVAPDHNNAITSKLPDFQKDNWLLAYSTVKHLLTRVDLPMPDGDGLSKTTKTLIPGRMEIIEKNDKTIILDSAHNQQKTQSLNKAIMSKFGNQKFLVLLALTQKPHQEVVSIVKEIIPLASYIIITKPSDAQDFPKKPQDAKSIADICKNLGYENYEISESLSQAIDDIAKRTEKQILITGSIYLVSKARQALLS